MINHTNNVDSIRDIKKGQLLVIQRKQDKRKLVVMCHGITNENEVLLSKQNDYFNFDMHCTGKSWVWRVWAFPVDVEITAITNNFNEFPR